MHRRSVHLGRRYCAIAPQYLLGGESHQAGSTPVRDYCILRHLLRHLRPSGVSFIHRLCSQGGAKGNAYLCIGIVVS